ncbi:transcobalamin-2 isoform X2 [Symphalangus syndactylus]|uniref:transcobalamin-2 isoform X2 n=1 Tax=Symphalangus syndactylus TaxID=9590 RepID=UPI00244173F5|nr:transcobalamin-2 isoform X2 [Symphalangus syndactylus]
MRHLGAFLFLLGVLGALADICEIPEVDSRLVEKLGQHLLPWMDRLSLEHLNPSIYVGLRLSSLQAGTKEDLYLHSLKLSYQQCLLGSAFSEDDGDCQGKPSMGQLALYLLALRANCKFVRGHKGDRLVSQLKRFLEDEKRAIGHDHKGHPHTSYYQYGLGILALCLHQKRVHDSVVDKLLYAVEPFHQGHHSVDTAAMAGLAFTCLKRSNFNPDRRQRITMAIRTVREKILKAQTPEGHFGNVYSTPLALQLLMTSPMPGAELGTACLKARVALLASLQDGAFQNALMISQLLPVLNHKTYIDLIFPDCLAPRVMLEPAAETIPQTQEIISVTLQVLSLLSRYRQSISVLAGSTMEDVLKKAHELGGFTYETQASLSGPYLTSVMGKAAGEREFWQLLRDPATPLLQGIADYRPKDGETIELRLVSW